MKHIVLACFSLSTIYIISYIYANVKRFIKNVHGEHFLSIRKTHQGIYPMSLLRDI